MTDKLLSQAEREGVNGRFLHWTEVTASMWIAAAERAPWLYPHADLRNGAINSSSEVSNG